MASPRCKSSSRSLNEEDIISKSVAFEGKTKDVDTNDLKHFFEKFGPVAYIHCKLIPNSKQMLGSGFIVFDNSRTARKVLSLKGFAIKSSVLYVKSVGKDTSHSLLSKITHEWNRDPRLSCNSKPIKSRILAISSCTNVNSTNPKRLIRHSPLKTALSNKTHSPSQKPTSTPHPHKKAQVELDLGSVKLKVIIFPSLRSAFRNALTQVDGTKLPIVKATEIGFALRQAISSGNVDEVSYLLSLPKSPKTNFFMDPIYLITAARKGFADICGLLLRCGANVDSRSPSGSTALMSAANCGHDMAMAVLLQWGASVDAVNSKMDSALLRAIRGHHVSGVLLLLAFGANPFPCIPPLLMNRSSIKTHHHQLPLQLARTTHQIDVQNALINANAHIEQYLVELVKSSLPGNAFLIEPGHAKTSFKSLSFIPVQIMSQQPQVGGKAGERGSFTFDTPPLYTDQWEEEEEEWTPDELILLYIACVDLQEGELCSPWNKNAMPGLMEISFNGKRSRPELLLQSGASFNDYDAGESAAPGFRVFVLGSKLNRRGVNTLTLDTKQIVSAADTSKTASVVEAERRRNLYPWRNRPCLTPAAQFEISPSSPFEKLLLGIYRVRIGVTAFLKSPTRTKVFPQDEETTH